MAQYAFDSATVKDMMVRFIQTRNNSGVVGQDVASDR
jgi:hypothetical protein